MDKNGNEARSRRYSREKRGLGDTGDNSRFRRWSHEERCYRQAKRGTMLQKSVQSFFPAPFGARLELKFSVIQRFGLTLNANAIYGLDINTFDESNKANAEFLRQAEQFMKDFNFFSLKAMLLCNYLQIFIFLFEFSNVSCIRSLS